MVTPLNWGLGHATRCMPIIDGLLERNCQVILASDGRAFKLLQSEYPKLSCIELNSYDIHYQKNGSFVRSILMQFPKILGNIRKEHHQLQELIEQQNISAVISDNRYGCYSDLIPSVFVSHQLAIKMPAHLRWLEPQVYRTNHWFINKFDGCWIPDFDGENNLSGTLARDFDRDKFTYLGPLSRLNKLRDQEQLHDICAVLSGPEPQRSILEEKLLKQLLNSPHRAVVVRGITESNHRQQLSDRLSLVDHMTSLELEATMRASGLIIARSGYSTIMDLAALQKPAILIPTPGQTEQEYLANRLSEQNYFVQQSQSSFQLEKAVKEVPATKPPSTPENNLLEKALDHWLETEKLKSY